VSGGDFPCGRRTRGPGSADGRHSISSAARRSPEGSTPLRRVSRIASAPRDARAASVAGDRWPALGGLPGPRPALPKERDDPPPTRTAGSSRLTSRGRHAHAEWSRKLREISRPETLAARADPLYVSPCTEHGARVGRSAAEGHDAEAEGQPAEWTKAQPAR
jgi:hypothetical protein